MTSDLDAHTMISKPKIMGQHGRSCGASVKWMIEKIGGHKKASLKPMWKKADEQNRS